MRAIGMLLLAVLLGAPTAATVCDVFCSHRAQTSTPTVSTHHSRHQHHAAAVDESADVIAARHHAAAGHQEPAVTTTDTVAESYLQAITSWTSDCCGRRDLPRFFLTATRADSDLLPKPQTVIRLAVLPDPSHRQSARTLQASRHGNIQIPTAQSVLRV